MDVIFYIIIFLITNLQSLLTLWCSHKDWILKEEPWTTSTTKLLQSWEPSTRGRAEKEWKKGERDNNNKTTTTERPWIRRLHAFYIIPYIYDIIPLWPIKKQAHTNNKDFCLVIGSDTVAILNNNKTYKFNSGAIFHNWGSEQIVQLLEWK